MGNDLCDLGIKNQTLRGKLNEVNVNWWSI
jgi:hypothetical protein